MQEFEGYGFLVTTFKVSLIFGATQERSADFDEDEDETKRTGVIDSSSDRSRGTE